MMTTLPWALLRVPYLQKSSGWFILLYVLHMQHKNTWQIVPRLLNCVVVQGWNKLCTLQLRCWYGASYVPCGWGAGMVCTIRFRCWDGASYVLWGWGAMIHYWAVLKESNSIPRLLFAGECKNVVWKHGYIKVILQKGLSLASGWFLFLTSWHLCH